jgi:copper(I)-binding protein
MIAASKRKEMRVNSARTNLRTVLVLAAIALSACQQNKTPDATVSDSTAPNAKPGIAAGDGVLRLPAVRGNPGAAYFSVRNGGPSAATLAAVHVDGAARSEMHESAGGSMATLKEVPLAAGESVKFAPGGKHVMLFDLDSRLTAGGTTRMTLIFAGGEKASIPLKIESAGGGMVGMPDMDHGNKN